MEAVLSALTGLRVLGLSGCRLTSVPRCLLERDRLLACYLEENRIGTVPDCTLLRQVVTLSLDWMPALVSAPVLRHADRLAQLFLCRPPSFVAHSDLLTQGNVLEAHIDLLIDALVALPHLHALTFVEYEDSRLRQRVPIGNGMLRLTARLAQARPDVKVMLLAQHAFYALTADQAERLVADLEQC